MPENIELAFIQDNARTEADSHIVNNFIDTDLFWNLFSPAHQVIYGSRGSGKTAITKMASFPFLRKYTDHRAKKLIANLDYIGVFVNTDIRFVGSLTNKVWSNESIKETYFIWKFNINCVKSLCVTLDSLLSEILGDSAERFQAEKSIANDLSKRFLKEQLNVRILELASRLSDYESQKREEINNEYLTNPSNITPPSDFFSVELFEPIQYATRVISRRLPKTSNSNWLFFVDEAEFLSETHHKIINSFMRANPDRVFLKMATLPYYHHTLETNLNVHLQPDDDFEYLYIDRDPINDLNSRNNHIYEFAKKLYSNRILHHISTNDIDLRGVDVADITNLDKVLGKSMLEEPKKLPTDINATQSKIAPYLSDSLLKRSQSLINNREKYGNEVWRKVSGFIALIDDKRNAVGQKQMTCYSGTKTVVRCTDGVPRKLINTFQELSKEVIRNIQRQINRNSRVNVSLSPSAQTKILKLISERRFKQTSAVPEVGPELRKFIDDIGRYLHHKLHKEKLTTDIIGSFHVDNDTPEHQWLLIRKGIAFGYIFPNVSGRTPAQLSEKTGSYRLTFSLSPHFDLYPRRGTSRLLQGIVRASKRAQSASNNRIETNSEQRSFDFSEPRER